MFSYHLNHKVRVFRQGKLLETHVNVWIDSFKVFVLLSCKKAVVFALVFNLILGLFLQ